MAVYSGCRVGREWKDRGSEEPGYEFYKRVDTLIFSGEFELG